MKTQKKTIEECRKSIVRYLSQIDYLELNKRYQEEEKYLLKIVRLSEMIYQQTFSSKDRNVLINNYIKISIFYEYIENKMDIVLRWYLKIVGILQKSSEQYSTNEEDYFLIDWYMKTIELLSDFKYFKKMIVLANNMKNVSFRVYRKTKTQEDLKKVILSKIYLADAFENSNHPLKAYYYYNDVYNAMIKIYHDIYDEGMKQDILQICDHGINLTKKSLLKIFHKKWLVRKTIVEED